MSNKTKSTKGLQPNLRFPEFRNAGDWEHAPLKSFCRIQTGKKDANEGAEGGKYPFFTCADKHIYSNSYSFDTEAILVAGNANVGQTKYYNGRFEAYQRTYVLNDFSGIEVPYLYALLSANLQNLLLKQVQTSAMSYIKLPMLQEYRITFPHNPKEQKKIADCLSSLDDLIEAEDQKLKALQQHNKALMRALFPAEGKTFPKLRFPEFRNASEWELKVLGDLCDMQAGKFVPASEIHEEMKEELYPCYGGNGLRGFVKAYSHEGIYPLIGRQGALCGNINMGRGLFYATEHAVVATVKKNVDVNWLYYQLIKLNLNQYATGQAQPGLSVDVLEKVISSIPSDPKEQQRIADFLSSTNSIIAFQSQKLNSLRNHKKGLMQRLFPAIESEG